MNVVGYTRVSTDEQADNGAGMDAQRFAISAECVRRRWTLLRIEGDAASGRSALELGEDSENARHHLALWCRRVDTEVECHEGPPPGHERKPDTHRSRRTRVARQYDQSRPQGIALCKWPCART